MIAAAGSNVSVNPIMLIRDERERTGELKRVIHNLLFDSHNRACYADVGGPMLAILFASESQDAYLFITIRDSIALPFRLFPKQPHFSLFFLFLVTIRTSVS